MPASASRTFQAFALAPPLCAESGRIPEEESDQVAMPLGYFGGRIIFSPLVPPSMQRTLKVSGTLAWVNKKVGEARTARRDGCRAYRRRAPPPAAKQRARRGQSKETTAIGRCGLLPPHAQPPTELSLALSDRPRRFEEGCQLNHAKPPSESFAGRNLPQNSRRRSLIAPNPIPLTDPHRPRTEFSGRTVGK